MKQSKGYLTNFEESFQLPQVSFIISLKMFWIHSRMSSVEFFSWTVNSDEFPEFHKRFGIVGDQHSDFDPIFWNGKQRQNYLLGRPLDFS